MVAVGVSGMSQLSAPVRHPVLACADRVEDALKDAAGTDPVFMRTPDKAEALVCLTGLVDQLETLRLRVIAASGDVADRPGAPNVASWLAPRIRGDHRPAHRTESLAESLDSRWTLLGDATASGRVTLAQAEVIARALDNLDADVSADLLRRAEAHLVDQAALVHPPAAAGAGRDGSWRSSAPTPTTTTNAPSCWPPNAAPTPPPDSP